MLVDSKRCFMETKDIAKYGLPPKEALILQEYRDKHATFEKLLDVVKKSLPKTLLLTISTSTPSRPESRQKKALQASWTAKQESIMNCLT